MQERRTGRRTKPSAATKTPESLSSFPAHEFDVSLQIPLRPLGVTFEVGLCARHHQNVFMSVTALFVFCLSSALQPRSERHRASGANGGSSSLVRCGDDSWRVNSTPRAFMLAAAWSARGESSNLCRTDRTLGQNARQKTSLVLA
jgi:hypothetical protein